MVGKAFVATAAFNALTGVSAFWRMQCHGRTGMGQVDPIVDFGKPASHAHALHGSSGLTSSASNDDLKGGNCTSCAVKQDMSAYWIPLLFFKDDSTGEYELVEQVGGLLAYYLLRNPEGDGKVEAFPDGFRLLAGNTKRRTYTVGDPTQPDPPTSNWASLGQTTQDDLEQRALGFNCLNYDKPPEGSLYRHYLPDKSFTDANCKDGLRLEIMFPSCWDGKNIDSADHKSHMAYPDLVGDGTCPEGFPVRLVTLFYEVIWATKSDRFDGRSGQFVLANDDPTGFGYHADFMTGWPKGFLEDAIDRCTNPSGELFDCPVFTESGPLQTEQEQADCLLEEPEVDLALDISLDLSIKTLPGREPDDDDDDDDDGGATTTSSSSAGFFDGLTSAFGFGSHPTTTSSSQSVPTSSSAPAPASSSSSESAGVPGVPGGAFLQSATSSSQAVSTTSSPTSNVAPEAAPTSLLTTTPPPQPEVTSEPGVSYEVVSTEIVTQGGKVQEIVWKEAVVYVTEDSVTTATVDPTAAMARRSHWLRHQHHGHRA